MNEKFSVIITLFNKGPYIARALRSVFNQTVQEFEIIVVDGGSHDEGPKIVNDFDDPRLHFIKQRGKGLSNARNEGVTYARNDYIAFLDADDEWMPNHLETIMRLIMKFPDAGLYASAYKIHTSEGITRWANYQNIPKAPWEGLLPDYFKSGALGEYPVFPSSSVIPKKTFIDVGGSPEGYWWAEDADLFGRIALKYKVAFSWELGVIYHWDAENRLCDVYKENIELDFEDEPFIHTARAVFERKEVPSEMIESLHEYIARREIIWAYRYINRGRYDKAKILLKQCKTQWFKKERNRFLCYVYKISTISILGKYRKIFLSLFKS